MLIATEIYYTYIKDKIIFNLIYAGIPMNHIIDVEQITEESRHACIFRFFDGLALGENIILQLKHDPKALYFQFLFERSGQFSWDKSMTEQGFEIKITRLRAAAAEQKPSTEMKGCRCMM
jgi:uncharacterized protein (DUF2249 family)